MDTTNDKKYSPANDIFVAVNGIICARAYDKNPHFPRNNILDEEQLLKSQISVQPTPYNSDEE